MPKPAAVLALTALALAPGALAAQAANRDVPAPAVQPLGLGGGATERMAAATRAAQPPVLDGRMDDPVWRDAQEITGFRQFDPVEDGEPLFPTMAKVAYDERNLYVFVRAFDPHPDSIVSLLSRRDVRTESDQIKIMVDSYLDRRTGYEFAVNPAGVKRDYYMHGDVNEDESWDAVWEVATAIDSLGWTAEFRIPLSQMRFARKHTHTFGFAVWRDIARAAQRISWPVYRRSQPGVVSQLGELTNIAGIESGRRLEIAPYAVTRNRTRQGPDAAYSHPQEFEAGADLKVGLTSNLTVDATINPDFGQVEADPAQFNLSSTESFFAEKRPFFLEGTGIFRFDLSCSDGNCSGLFYSRRIGRSPRVSDWYDASDPDAPDVTTILGAAKLTGRLQRGLSVGVLSAVTQREVARYSSADATIEPLSNYFVGRLQQDFREGRSSLGTMVTAVNRRLDQWTDSLYTGAAYAVGIDGRHRFAKDWQVGAYLVGSHVRGTEEAIARLQDCRGAFGCAHNYTRPDDDVEFDPTRDALRGASMQIGLEDLGGNWRGSVYYTRTTPGFEINDVGYVGRDDMQSLSNWWQRRWETPTTWYRRIFVNFNQWANGTTGGTLTGLGGNVNGHIEFANRWWIHAGGNLNNWLPVYCDRNCTRGGPALKESAGELWTWAEVESDFRKPLAFWWGAEIGREDEGKSTFFWTGPGVSFRVASQLQGRVNVGTSRTHDDVQYYGTYDLVDGPHYTIARLDQRTTSLTARLDYTVTPTLSLQFYGQPFVTSGRYSRWREVTSPRADRHDDRFSTFEIDEDGNGIPDDPGGFDYKQFRSNSVLRWEYRPGSALFLVWAQGRTSDDTFRDFDLRRSVRTLFERHPDNTFLVKASYWFNP
jgi:hypothetical protein